LDTVTKFWNMVRDVWGNGLWGIDIGRYLVAIGIVLIFLAFRRLLMQAVVKRIKVLASKTETEIDDKIVDAADAPLQFIPVILGIYFAAVYLPLQGDVEAVVEQIIRSMIVFTIFWALVNVTEPLSFLLKRVEELFSASMVEWLIKATKACLVFIGAATIFEIWGIKIGPIIAGLGLFGVAVALGAQDLFKNLISGFLVIGERRFNPGDWIRVDGIVEGTVESIGFRSTLIRRFDKAPVYVPNSNLSDNAVTNFSAMTHRRIYWTIGVEYRATKEQLQTIRSGIEEYILSKDDFAKPPAVPTFVRIDAFNSSSIDIMVYCFTKSTNWGTWLEIKENLAYHIKDTVEAAGTGFAFPSQSLYVETLPDDMPERFLPPESAGNS